MHIAALLAVAEKPVPLIDIDGTVFIQFGIFVAMAGVLWALVFKPFLKVLDERKLRIDGAREDASKQSSRADEMLQHYEAQLLQAKQRGAEERAALRAEGLAFERDVLERSRALGQKAYADAQSTIRQQRDTARATLLGDAGALGKDIAERILVPRTTTGAVR